MHCLRVFLKFSERIQTVGTSRPWAYIFTTNELDFFAGLMLEHRL